MPWVLSVWATTMPSTSSSPATYRCARPRSKSYRMIRRYTGRWFARYSSVPLSIARSSGCTACDAAGASHHQRSHGSHERQETHEHADSDAEWLEAELDDVLASWHRHHAKQQVAA